MVLKMHIIAMVPKIPFVGMVLKMPIVAMVPKIPFAGQDSSKGGAVETGCSDLYDVIYYCII